MPNPKASESAKIQGDKLEAAVDRVVTDRSDREDARQHEKSEKRERERRGDAGSKDDTD